MRKTTNLLFMCNEWDGWLFWPTPKIHEFLEHLESIDPVVRSRCLMDLDLVS